MELRKQIPRYPFLEGGGEMGELTRNVEWSQTSIGTPDKWPHSLRTTVSNLLRSRFPMFLWWGPEMIQFYNDAYRPSLGNKGKHPAALAARGKDTWPEIWEIVSPLMMQVETTGEATWMENQLVPIFRNGKIEDVYWTYSYSSVLDDEGKHSGILVTCMETTTSVIAESKLKENTDRMEFALTAAHLGSWELDLQTFELQASSICKQIFGQPIDRPFSYQTLINTIHPEDRQRQQEAVLHTITTGADYDIEYRVIFPDASIHWVNIRGQVRYNAHNVVNFMVGVSLDITQRKESEDKLAQSEAGLRRMIEQAPVAIGLTKGEDFIFETINAPMLQIIRKPAKEAVLGKSLTDILPELVHQPVFDRLRHVLRTGENFRGTDVEAELFYDGGLQRHYFNITYSRVVDKNGIPSIMHMASDVTEQVIAKRKTEESEAKLRSILDSAPTAICMFVGPDLIVENPNRLLIEVIGAGPDIAGKSFRKVLSGVVEEDQTFIRLIDEVRETGIPFEAKQVPVYFREQDKTRHFNISFIPLFDSAGTVYAVLDVSVDVTEQVVVQQKIEESRTELATALEQVRLSKEAAELGTFDLDLKKGTMHWDDRCRILFGISHQEPVTYEKDFVFGLHPDDRERIIKLIDRAFIKEQSDGEYDVQYRTVGAEDGVERWVKAKGKVYFDQLDAPVRFIGSVLDITVQMSALQKVENTVRERTQELAEVNRSLQITNKELQRSNQHLEEFAHAASHDLKEPIRKIRVFTDQLRRQLRGTLSDAALQAFARIDIASQRMSDLINDLLLYSHVSQRPLDKQPVDLNDAMQKVMEDLELIISESSAIIHVADLPVVNGYSRQLQQLFQNILSNALKYSRPNEAPVIEITATSEEVMNIPYHVILVKDNGIGFEQKFADQIFQMFARLHAKNEYSGTGVGLSIAKKVVENHDGLIRVESVPGEGATFHIFLPA